VESNRVNKFVTALGKRRARDAEKTASQPSQVAPVTDKRTTAPPTSQPFFDPQMLAKLGQLELIAQAVVDGFLSGKHRSTHKGGCTDFAEFRPYSRGDDIRQLDWRHYARSDRYYVKRYDDETNLQALLVVDSSGSMDFGMSTVSKWRYSQMAAASLAHLLLRQRDSVGLAIVGSTVLDFLKPQPRSSHLARMLDLLGGRKPTGPSAIADVLPQLMGRLKRRGMVILLSDCFGDVVALRRSLEQFRFFGHDVIVCQILAPEELTFPFRREAFFQDLELFGRLQINPNTIRKSYLKELQTFMGHLRTAMTEIGVDLMTFQTSDDLGEVLGYHLRRRAAMNGLQMARAR
jgi:uncharacterized protein (DUF58 family)